MWPTGVVQQEQCFFLTEKDTKSLVQLIPVKFSVREAATTQSAHA